jgi:hypothetical protein
VIFAAGEGKPRTCVLAPAQITVRRVGRSNLTNSVGSRRLEVLPSGPNRKVGSLGRLREKSRSKMGIKLAGVHSPLARAHSSAFSKRTGEILLPEVAEFKGDLAGFGRAKAAFCSV